MDAPCDATASCAVSVGSTPVVVTDGRTGPLAEFPAVRVARAPLPTIDADRDAGSRTVAAAAAFCPVCTAGKPTDGLIPAAATVPDGTPCRADGPWAAWGDCPGVCRGTATASVLSGGIECGKFLPSPAPLTAVLPSVTELARLTALPSFAAGRSAPGSLAQGAGCVPPPAADSEPLACAGLPCTVPCAARTAGNELPASLLPPEAGTEAGAAGRATSGRDGGRKLGCGMALLSDRHTRWNTEKQDACQGLPTRIPGRTCFAKRAVRMASDRTNNDDRAFGCSVTLCRTGKITANGLLSAGVRSNHTSKPGTYPARSLSLQGKCPTRQETGITAHCAVD